MSLDVLTLADIQLDLLFERDARGLLLRSRDHAVRAPLVHLVRTALGNRWLLAAALTDSLRARLDEALAAEPVIDDLAALEGTPPVLAMPRNTDMRALFSTSGPAPEGRGPAFVFPDALPTPTAAIEVLADPRDARTVPELAWVRTASMSARPLVIARNDAGEVASVCHSSRSTPEAAAAGVETAPAYRGRGLAGAVTLGWAAAVRTEGRVPIYSTQWTNAASRAVARKLGLVPWGEDVAFG